MTFFAFKPASIGSPTHLIGRVLCTSLHLIAALGSLNSLHVNAAFRYNALRIALLPLRDMKHLTLPYRRVFTSENLSLELFSTLHSLNTITRWLRTLLPRSVLPLSLRCHHDSFVLSSHLHWCFFTLPLVLKPPSVCSHTSLSLASISLGLSSHLPWSVLTH